MRAMHYVGGAFFALALAVGVALFINNARTETPTELRAIDASGATLNAQDVLSLNGVTPEAPNTPSSVVMTYTDAEGQVRVVTVDIIYSDELLYTYVNKDGTLVDRMRRGAGEQLRKALIPDALRRGADGLRSELSDAEVLISSNRYHYLGRKGKDNYRMVVASKTKLPLVLLTLPAEGVQATFSVVLKVGKRTVDVPVEILD